VLEAQVGHLLRRAHQRASAIFMEIMGEHKLTPTQFAALAKIGDEGSVSQNRLGRLTAMDPATMQGVVRRLIARGLIRRDHDPGDRRRTMLGLTTEGRRLVERTIPLGKEITTQTLAPLDRAERAALLRLLKRLT
jgi:DNA-binding MarR family transcriptional regulator